MCVWSIICSTTNGVVTVSVSVHAMHVIEALLLIIVFIIINVCMIDLCIMR